jgi:hypothetical protein
MGRFLRRLVFREFQGREYEGKDWHNPGMGELAGSDGEGLA